MGKRKEDFDVLTYTVEQLDRVALTKAGVVGTLHPSDGLERADVSDYRVEDWTFRWVATLGEDNQGRLVLIPTGARTRRLAVVGHAFELSRRYELLPQEAIEVVRATHGIPGAHELRVLSCVAETLQAPFWESYPGGEPEFEWIDSVRRTHGDQYPMLKRLSVEKLKTVCRIHAQWEDTEVFKPKIYHWQREWSRAIELV